MTANPLAAEIEWLLAQSDGLAFMRGRWIEVDRERLSRTLEQFEVIEQRAVTDGLTFGEAMRMLAGARIAADGAAGHADVDWSQTVAGPWLAETLAALRRPTGFVDMVNPSGEHSALSQTGAGLVCCQIGRACLGTHGARQDQPVLSCCCDEDEALVSRNRAFGCSA